MTTHADTSAARSFTVSGMTCSNCVTSVHAAICELKGDNDVDVDRDSGRVSVSGEGFTDQSVVAAIAQTGYEVIS